MASAQLDDRQSQAPGTGISMGVHALIVGVVLFFAAIHPPDPGPTHAD